MTIFAAAMRPRHAKRPWMYIGGEGIQVKVWVLIAIGLALLT